MSLAFKTSRVFLACVVFVSISGWVGAQEEPLFEIISPGHSGVHFRQEIKDSINENYLSYIYMYNGGGVAIGDVNNDGRPDLFFSGNQVDNQLMLNKGGFKFSDGTKAAGVSGTGRWSSGVTMVDINSDGWLDIYVCASGFPAEKTRHRNQFFINNGDGTFTDKASEMGLAVERHSTQATFLDYDQDGDLDIYVLNHPILFGNDWIVQSRRFPGPENPGADQLFQNQGNGQFVDVTVKAGLGRPGYGLSVTAADLNNDGWPDLFVANDFNELDALYINNQNGTFKETTKKAFDHVSQYGMGSDIADINGDGYLDIIEMDMMAEDNLRKKTMMSGMNTMRFWKNVAQGNHYQYMQNTLQLNLGDGRFTEIAELAGVANTDWSWAPLIADFDQDGRPDLFVTNGMRWEMNDNDFNRKLKLTAKENPDAPLSMFHELLAEAPSTPMANYAYRNLNGLKFEKVTSQWGLDLPGYSYGAAYSDLDGDGDLDLVLNNMDGVATLYRSRAASRKNANWLTVKLTGKGSNKMALGARVMLTADGNKQVRELTLSRGYMSSVAPELHFGLGAAAKINGLWVQWPDGEQEYFSASKVNTTHKLAQGKGQKRPWPKKNWAGMVHEIKKKGRPLFIHRERPYDDFKAEILLPHKQSQHGPGLATADANGDGLDDFFVGGAAGQAGGLFFQNEKGSFVRKSGQPWSSLHKGQEDLSAVFVDIDQDGDQDLYVASGSNEFPSGSPLYQDRLYLNDGQGQFTDASNRLPAVFASSGRVIAVDLDQDGDSDFVVAGRLSPGEYPLPGQTRILINQKGTFTDQAQTLAPGLESVGMVTDLAAFDVEGDGDIDLVVAGEWMAVTLFRNNGGQFKPEPLTSTEDTTGWWFSLLARDLDGDGDIDLAAGNLGLNSKYRGTKTKPFTLFAQDFDDNGSLDLVLAYHNQGKVYPVRGRQCSSDQMPFIKKKFKNYRSFGGATLREIYGDKLDKGWRGEAQQFASGWFENREGSFVFHVFGAEAQMGPIMAWVQTDLNGDGQMDLVGAGGLYTAEVETVRHDGQKGTLLIQTKKGKFKAEPPSKNGAWAAGDIKDAELLKTAKGDTIVVVAQNNGPVKIFRLGLN